MEKITRSDFDDVMVPNYAPVEIIPVRGQGSRIWDQSGNEYIDLTAGIAVNSLGHCYPPLIDAIQSQSQNLWHVSNIFTNEPALRLAKKLTADTFADKVFFANSGAEANEAALKLARRYAKDKFSEDKNQIISFNQSFHGRTFFTVTAGGQAAYSDGFGPKPGGVFHAEFNDIASLETYVSSQTCAIIVELIQGEGGVNPIEHAFIVSLRALCDQYDALLIFDEVQTGVGRTGSFYAYEKLGVEPDILTSAKGLGGGFPIGAMLTKKHIAASFVPGTHGSTYGGNPLACAVSEVVVDTVNQPEFLHAVLDKSSLIKAGLIGINERFGIFKEVRGEGLLIGAELTDKYAGQAGSIMKLASEQGVLILIAGANVLRFTPALNIPDQDIDLALAKLECAITAWLSTQ